MYLLLFRDYDYVTVWHSFFYNNMPKVSFRVAAINKDGIIIKQKSYNNNVLVAALNALHISELRCSL